MMRFAPFAAVAVGAAVLCLASAQAAAQAAETAASPPTYTPPKRGAPSRRVGGASRGFGAAFSGVRPLAPDHVALTVSQNPPLYWYYARRSPARVEITLADDKGRPVLVEQALARPGESAVRRLDLARHGVALEPGVEYRWSIAVATKPHDPFNDVGAAASLMRVPVPARIAALKAPSKPELARALAAEGIWYDALAIYSELIDANPADRMLREHRAALLEQAGLAEAAAHERGAGR